MKNWISRVAASFRFVFVRLFGGLFFGVQASFAVRT